MMKRSGIGSGRRPLAQAKDGLALAVVMNTPLSTGAVIAGSAHAKTIRSISGSFRAATYK